MADNQVNIFLAGDFVSTLRVTDYIEKGLYGQLFNDILPVIKMSDFSVVNLEAPLIENGQKIQKTGPNLKSSPKTVDALKFAGFDMVTLANNHIMDYGKSGFLSTIKLLDSKEIDYVGAGVSIAEASEVKIKQIGNYKIAFINAAEDEWSTLSFDGAVCNSLNPVDLYSQIENAKKNADYVVLIVHGGHENYGLPSPEIRKTYRYFVDLGVDAVVGHHTHCFGGHEIYKDKIIVYSLGNFIFDRTDIEKTPDWNTGCGLVLTFENNKIKHKFYPFYQCGKTAGIQLFDENENEAFEQKVQQKNAVILDDDQLEQSFDKYVENQRRIFTSYIEPFTNKYILAAMNRGFLPRFMRFRKKILLLNLIRCESHRNLLTRILEKEYRSYK